MLDRSPNFTSWIGVHPFVSRYYSPYATKHNSRRWLPFHDVLLALVVGVGVGNAPSGGYAWLTPQNDDHTPDRSSARPCLAVLCDPGGDQPGSPRGLAGCPDWCRPERLGSLELSQPGVFR